MKTLSKYTAILASMIVAVALIPSAAQASGIHVSVPGVIVSLGGGHGYHHGNSYYKKKYYNANSYNYKPSYYNGKKSSYYNKKKYYNNSFKGNGFKGKADLLTATLDQTTVDFGSKFI